VMDLMEGLEERRGVNVGFFYLRAKGAEATCKVQVFVEADGDVRHVWDGERWRAYEAFEPADVLEDAIEQCRAFNGALQ